jgi:hypothetical protein
MDKFIRELSALASILSIRKVGNTSMLKAGTATYDRPFICIGVNMQQALELAGDNKMAQPVTLNSIKSKLGSNLPIAIDSHTMASILSSAIAVMSTMDEGIKVRNSTIAAMIDLIDLLQKRSLEVENLERSLIMCNPWDFNKRSKIRKTLEHTVLNRPIEIEHAFEKLLKIATNKIND